MMFLDYFRFLVEFMEKWMNSAKSGNFSRSYVVV